MKIDDNYPDDGCAAQYFFGAMPIPEDVKIRRGLKPFLLMHMPYYHTRGAIVI